MNCNCNGMPDPHADGSPSFEFKSYMEGTIWPADGSISGGWSLTVKTSSSYSRSVTHGR